MPKDISIGSVWQKPDGIIMIVTKEKNKDLESQYGELCYCQEIGDIGGLWASPDYIKSYWIRKSANFSPTA